MKLFLKCLPAMLAVLSFLSIPAVVTAKKSDAPIIYGNMVSNSLWSGLDFQQVPRGIYRLPLKSDIASDEITPVVTHPFMNCLYGGTVDGGIYRAVVSHLMPDIPYSTVYCTEFDIDEGRLLVDTLCLSSMQMAINTTTDPKTGTVYGIYYGDQYQQTYEFGTMDYTTMTRGEKKFTVTQPYVLVATGSDIYAIGYDDGFFYRVDVEGETFEKIGDTGLGTLKFYENQWQWYAYPQSMVYDHRSGRLYWAEYRRTDWSAYESNLYEVNMADGSLTLLSRLPDLVELTNLYVPWEPADGAPDDLAGLTVDFAQGSLAGQVEFDVPAVAYDGAALTGSVTCYVVANGDTVAVRQAEPGEHAVVDVKLKAGGSTYFKVTAANEAGNSNGSGKRIWIGYDYPLAVEGLRASLDKASGVVTVTWNRTAGTEGVNGGYVDAENVTYTVTRYPDEVVVADNISENEWRDNLPEGDMRSYYYAVEASNGEGFASQTALSGRCIYGNPFGTPFFDDVDGTVSQYLYTVVDGNADGITWQSGEKNSVATETRWEYNGTQSTQTSDDWLITPAISLSTDSLYRFEFVAGTTRTWNPSTVEAGFGTDVEDVAGFELMVEPVSLDGSTLERRLLGKNFTVSTAGAYHFGIHAVSETTQGIVIVDSISVKSLGLIGAPDSVTALTVTAAELGAYAATVSFVAPVVTSTGGELTSLSRIEVWRDGDVLVDVLNDVQPGAEYTVSDNGESMTTGYHSYTAVAYNDRGKGLYNPPVKAWFGPDAPLMPENVRLNDNLDGTYSVTWTVPKRGVHGGYVETEMLDFTINRVSATNWVQGLIASGVKGTGYRGELPETQWKQDFMYVSVSAAGEGMPATARAISNGMQYGTPNELPFVESCEGGRYTNGQTVSLDGSDMYTRFLAKTDKAVDEDGGSMGFTGSTVGSWAKIGTGMISLAGATAPKLIYSYYALPGVDVDLQVDVVKADGQESTTVSRIDFGELSGEEGWRTDTIDISGWLGEHHIYVYFMATVGQAYTSVYLDRIIVCDMPVASGVGNVVVDGCRIGVEPGALTVSGASGAPVKVVSVDGRMVWSGYADSHMRLSVPQGLYIVTAGNKRATVAVR